MATSKVTADLDSQAFRRGFKAATKGLKFNSEAELIRFAYNVRNKAIVHCPVDTGRLRNSIGILGQGRDEKGFYIKVGTKVEYAAVVEFGSRPHVIRAKKAKVLANKKTGQVFGKEVNHPGTSAQPYMRPALLESALQWKPRITP